MAIKLSDKLNLPLEFFMKENSELDSNDNIAIFFRSLRSTSNKLKDSLSQNILFIEEIYNYFSMFIDYPKFDVKDIKNSCKTKYKLGVSDEYIEEISLKIRKLLGLGEEPIENLTRVLEENGVVVTRIELNTHNVDAFSTVMPNGVPIIILGSDKKSAVRSRMDLAHELGHIILHSDIEKEEVLKNNKIIEDEAKRFASAFLLPDKQFSDDIYNINLDNYIYLKRKWKVSIAGMIVRSHQLDLITDDQYLYLFKRISAKKWRIVEPLDDVIEFEKPSLLKESIDLLLENNIVSVDELVKDLAFSRKEIESLCYLEANYLGEDEVNKKVHLKIIK